MYEDRYNVREFNLDQRTVSKYLAKDISSKNGSSTS
jgi:hypothetical protein